jgi:hypothetical protein
MLLTGNSCVAKSLDGEGGLAFTALDMDGGI